MVVNVVLAPVDIDNDGRVQGSNLLMAGGQQGLSLGGPVPRLKRDT